MNTKTTFVNRDQLTKNNQNPKKVDAQKIIDYFISLHPMNRVRVGSPLYNLAIRQYNENIKNTMVRPPVPQWFCGKVNTITGELLNKPTDEQERATAGLVSDVPNNQNNVPQGPSGQYNIDQCLEKGLPGSFDYAKCATGQDATQAEEAIEEWETSMESVNEQLEALRAAAEEAASSGGDESSSSGSENSSASSNNDNRSVWDVIRNVRGVVQDVLRFINPF